VPYLPTALCSYLFWLSMIDISHPLLRDEFLRRLPPNGPMRQHSSFRPKMVSLAGLAAAERPDIPVSTLD